nr:metabolite traffic protein EboE [Kineococcus aurantiacus]
MTYSTLVHPGDTWPEMRHSLETFVPQVKARVNPDGPFGVSLRLSGESARTLAGDEDERHRLRDWLAEQDLYVYTVNAFPQGAFKNRVVMEDVYEPDWSTAARADYTRQVADVLADITPEGVSPSIQTMPLAFKPKAGSAGYVEAFTGHVLDVAAHLVGLEQRTGRRVVLAIEPEPFCYLETVAETVEYFDTHLFSGSASQELARRAGIPLSEAPAALRRHLGIVLDMGHQCVEFDDLTVSLQLLADHGVPIFKLQAAAALWVPQVGEEEVAELEGFTDTIYLSQTTERGPDGRLRRFLNLSEAIAAWRADPRADVEWRTHFHVPVFMDRIGPFRTTRPMIEDALRAHVAARQSAHLEIETYTWDVLPAHLKTGDIVDYVSRELEFVRDVLTRA